MENEITWIKVVYEAMKILGPLLISALITLYVTRNQNHLKLEELKNNLSFKVRELIYQTNREKFFILLKVVKIHLKVLVT